MTFDEAGRRVRDALGDNGASGRDRVRASRRIMRRMVTVLALLRIVGVGLLLVSGTLAEAPMVTVAVGVGLSLLVAAWWRLGVGGQAAARLVLASVDVGVAVALLVQFDGRGIGFLYAAVTFVMWGFAVTRGAWVPPAVGLAVVCAVLGSKLFEAEGHAGWALDATVVLFLGCSLLLGRAVQSIVDSYEAELAVMVDYEREWARMVERTQIAQELQDLVSKSLSGCGFLAEGLARSLRVDGSAHAADAADLASSIRIACAESTQFLDELRRFCDAERQPLSERLIGVIGDYPGLNVGLSDDLPSFDDWRTRLMVVRAVRELLENVHKQSGADNAWVEIGADETAAVVRVGDDGPRSLAGQRRAEGRFGLNGLRERLETVGGTLRLGSGPLGTVVEIRLPLLRDDEAGAESPDGCTRRLSVAALSS